MNADVCRRDLSAFVWTVLSWKRCYGGKILSGRGEFAGRVVEPLSLSGGDFTESRLPSDWQQ